MYALHGQGSSLCLFCKGRQPVLEQNGTKPGPELYLVEGVGGLNGLHVDVRALGGAALVRVGGVERACVVRRNGGCQLIHQRLDGLVVYQLDLRCSAGALTLSRGALQAGCAVRASVLRRWPARPPSLLAPNARWVHDACAPPLAGPARLVDLVRGAEAVEEVHDRHAARQGGQVGHQREVLRLLHAVAAQHRPTGLAHRHHILLRRGSGERRQLGGMGGESVNPTDADPASSCIPSCFSISRAGCAGCAG